MGRVNRGLYKENSESENKNLKVNTVFGKL